MPTLESFFKPDSHSDFEASCHWAIEQITGASGHRFKGSVSGISIRGLGPFLSLQTFNGRVGTTAAASRDMNYQVFPSELTKSITIYKTQQADLIVVGRDGQHKDYRTGLIGKVNEVHTWTNRPIWPQGMRERPAPESIPAGLDWDLWLGPAAARACDALARIGSASALAVVHEIAGYLADPEAGAAEIRRNAPVARVLTPRARAPVRTRTATSSPPSAAGRPATSMP